MYKSPVFLNPDAQELLRQTHVYLKMSKYVQLVLDG